MVMISGADGVWEIRGTKLVASVEFIIVRTLIIIIWAECLTDQSYIDQNQKKKASAWLHWIKKQMPIPEKQQYKI